MVPCFARAGARGGSAGHHRPGGIHVHHPLNPHVDGVGAWQGAFRAARLNARSARCINSRRSSPRGAWPSPGRRRQSYDHQTQAADLRQWVELSSRSRWGLPGCRSLPHSGRADAERPPARRSACTDFSPAIRWPSAAGAACADMPTLPYAGNMSLLLASPRWWNTMARALSCHDSNHRAGNRACAHCAVARYGEPGASGVVFMLMLAAMSGRLAARQAADADLVAHLPGRRDCRRPVWSDNVAAGPHRGRHRIWDGVERDGRRHNRLTLTGETMDILTAVYQILMMLASQSSACGCEKGRDVRPGHQGRQRHCIAGGHACAGADDFAEGVFAR